MSAPVRKGSSIQLNNTFYKSQDVQDLLGDSPVYVEAQLQREEFLKACQITYHVDVTACIKRIRQIKENSAGQVRKKDLQKLYRKLESLSTPNHFLRVALHDAFPDLHLQDIAILAVSVERVFHERHRDKSH